MHDPSLSCGVGSHPPGVGHFRGRGWARREAATAAGIWPGPVSRYARAVGARVRLGRARAPTSALDVGVTLLIRSTPCPTGRPRPIVGFLSRLIPWHCGAHQTPQTFRFRRSVDDGSTPCTHAFRWHYNTTYTYRLISMRMHACDVQHTSPCDLSPPLRLGIWEQYVNLGKEMYGDEDERENCNDGCLDKRACRARDPHTRGDKGEASMQGKARLSGYIGPLDLSRLSVAKSKREKDIHTHTEREREGEQTVWIHGPNLTGSALCRMHTHMNMMYK